MNWKAYNELAWTDNVFACADSYKDEAMSYIKVLKEHITEPSPSMLHLHKRYNCSFKE